MFIAAAVNSIVLELTFKLGTCATVSTCRPMQALIHPDYNPSIDLDLLTSGSTHAEDGWAAVDEAYIQIPTLMLIVQAVVLIEHVQTYKQTDKITSN